MTAMFEPSVLQTLEATIVHHPYPLLFATVSGAHLYGFASPDSDFDLRGVHILPAAELLGLDPGPDTITEMSYDRLEVDLVTHDAAKFFEMVLKRNGYVLEQLFSPLVLRTTPEHAELKEIASRCVTSRHAHHYLGFAETQWALFEKEDPPRVKPLLYVFRVLLTGIHLMRTGVIEANLRVLNEGAGLAYIDELIALKTNGREKETLRREDLDFYRGEFERLRKSLELARDESSLPERPAARHELHDLLLRIRGVKKSG
jgi:predicted nucleotidyltransferase